MGELYDNPTELEEFENRFDDKINKLEELLDRVEYCIYNTQWETIEHINSTQWETIKHISAINEDLNKPFTRGEWFTLFIWWIWWNLVVSGLMEKERIYKIFFIIGFLIIIFTVLFWYYLLKKK